MDFNWRGAAEVLYLDPCNTGCIRSKFPFQINFGAKKKFLVFFKLGILEMYEV